MPTVNLKELYPEQYISDEYIEVDEAVYEALIEFRRHDRAAERQRQRYKAYFCIEAGYGIPKLSLCSTENEAFIDKETGLSFDMTEILNHLPLQQKTRIQKHIVLGLSIDRIAKEEKLHPQAIYKSIHRGLISLKKNFLGGV